MNIALNCSPFLISLLNGYLLILLLLKNDTGKSFIFHLTLATGLGLGISAYIGILNFSLLNHFSAAFQLATNIALLILTLVAVIVINKKNVNCSGGNLKQYIFKDSLYAFVLLLFLLPLYYIATFYPYGGWDAWAVWHFKAKFLFLSGDAWRNIFDARLWRSSPHYPLLVPFINVWGWVCSKDANYHVPMFTSLIFTFLSVSLLVISFTQKSMKILASFAAIALLTNPFYAKTSISQYADVVLGFFLLASLICLQLAQTQQKNSYAFLSGIFIGFLSFTKAEGLIAAIILAALSCFYIGWPFKEKSANRRLLIFLGGLSLTLLPSLMFYFFIAPDNVTSINGFLSHEHPSSWLRFKTITVFHVMEIISFKWNGLWLVIFASLLLNAKKCFNKSIWIVPAFLILYASAIFLYYLMNTYFEILWWLSVTLGRILASILPVILWWVLKGFDGQVEKN